MIDEIRDPKILSKIADYRSLGSSWTFISKKIREEFNIEASDMALKRAYDSYISKATELVSQDDTLKYAIKGRILQVEDQLKKVNESMMSILSQRYVKDSDKVSAAREILRQLQFQEKLLERLKEGFDTKRISRIEYTKVSVNNLEELERLGYIKVLRKPETTEIKQVLEIEEVDKKEDEEDDEYYQEDEEGAE